MRIPLDFSACSVIPTPPEIQVHTILYPLHPMKLPNEALQFDPIRTKDGAYSRVFKLQGHFGPTMPDSSMGQVLKVTCCKPTRVLLDTVMQKPTPNLPFVIGSFGACAQNAEGMRFHGYVLKELQAAQSLEQTRRVVELLNRLAFYKAKYDVRSTPAWLVSQKTAKAMARDNAFGTREAFRRLVQVMERVKSVLDLNQPGNILFDADGQVCLADPLYQFEEAPGPFVWADKPKVALRLTL